MPYVAACFDQRTDYPSALPTMSTHSQQAVLSLPQCARQLKRARLATRCRSARILEIVGLTQFTKIRNVDGYGSSFKKHNFGQVLTVSARYRAKCAACHAAAIGDAAMTKYA